MEEAEEEGDVLRHQIGAWGRQAQDEQSEDVEERPSTSLGTNEEERLQANKHRVVQVARTGGRKLFDEALRSVFLEWFAATCNVKLSAEKAGVNYKTVFKHRMNDERFAEAWDRALAQGVARLKAKLLETKAKETPIGIDGDLDAPEMEEVDPALGMQLLREHERRLAGYPKRGAVPRVATNAEVREALVKRLAAFGVRVSAGGEAAGERDPSVIASEARQSGDAAGLDRHGADAPRDDV